MNGIASFATNLDPANLPPLPAPWTQHIAPTGHYYYYNLITSESTYIRPISLTLLLPPVFTKPPKRKKEKPQNKAPVPDSLWIRVVTNRGNVFYANKETKESTWTMPEEITDAVAAMELDENDGENSETAIQVKEDEDQDAMVVDKQSGSKGKGRKRLNEASDDERGGKRVKSEQPGTIEHTPPRDKKRKDKKHTIAVEDAKDEDEDEEEWQRRLAEEMAVEDAEETDTNLDVPVEEAAPSISNEEATALFKSLLQERDINPMIPWETTVSAFGNDESYGTVSKVLSTASQRDIFEEYCKEVIKERRKAKSEETTGKTPLDAYQELLQATVTSTRTTYTQFRQQVKKDRRFYSFGRDEKEREKVFRSFQKELGEQKRSERKRAEEAFLTMLKEGQKNGLIVANPPSKWNEVKKAFQQDPRYDSVGSSSLREELFETFLKTLKDEAEPHSTATEVEDEKKRRRERAVKEREEKVRLMQQQVERNNARSKAGLNKEEAELAFK
ncbi:hypothetical protein FRC17_004622 [Serendipita sp. 399]|nr:hypothetical protein FRC17_004622 [Serendipita sp. 399]